MIIKFLLFVSFICQLQANDLLAPYREKAAEWEDDVSQLVAKNDQQLAGPDDLLFVGSSSIRLWDSIEEDMSGHQVVRRGYGGARYSDLAIYLERILDGHKPKALIYFVANDISGDETRDISPEEVGRLTLFVAETSRRKFPNTPIYFIQITPTPKRWHVWNKIAEANRCIQETTRSVDNCRFIFTQSYFLDPHTHEPIAELFREDRLHLNDKGYDLWAEAIKKGLEDPIRSAE